MKRVIFGIVAAVIVVGALIGVGGMAYQMGIAQGAGYAAFTQPRADGVVPPTEGMPNFGRGQGYAPGYPMPMQPGAYYGNGHSFGPMGGFGRMGGFNPFGGLFCVLGGLFILFLVFALIRGLFFRPMGWGLRGGMNGGWRGHGEVPPWAVEWHRKMHETQTAPPPAGDAKTAGDPPAAA
ncbi:MAG: hypothetical protein ABIQ99_08050 [Thermoflexales bacterium]